MPTEWALEAKSFLETSQSIFNLWGKKNSYALLSAKLEASTSLLKSINLSQDKSKKRLRKSSNPATMKFRSTRIKTMKILFDKEKNFWKGIPIEAETVPIFLRLEISFQAE